jgi:hypothetical protein
MSLERIDMATSQEISRGTSPAHTTRAADTYGENPERRARARGQANSSKIPLPQKGTPNSSEGAEPNSGNSDLSSENPGKNRSMNISNLPDGLNISNLPDGLNISNLPAESLEVISTKNPV